MSLRRLWRLTRTLASVREGALKKKILTVQSRNVYENKGSLDIMTDEMHVFEANFRTFWHYVIALCTEFTLFERNFEVTCGHFAVTLRHCSGPVWDIQKICSVCVSDYGSPTVRSGRTRNRTPPGSAPARSRSFAGGVRFLDSDAVHRTPDIGDSRATKAASRPGGPVSTQTRSSRQGDTRTGRNADGGAGPRHLAGGKKLENLRRWQ